MRPARNKEAIVKSSLKLFCKKGFSDTSIKEIAALANVSPGNVYNYFRSKEEMFEHLFSMYFPGKHIEKLIAGVSSGKSFEDSIETALNNILDFVKKEPYFFRLILIDANEFGGRYLKKYSKPYSRPVEEYFKDEADIPDLRADIESTSFTEFFSWLFYAIGLTNIIYANFYSHNNNKMKVYGLKGTPIYKVLLKVLQKGLKKQQGRE